MKRAINYAFFLWPIFVLAYLIIITLSSQDKIAEKLLQADGLIWGKGDEQMVVRVKQASSEEQKTFVIRLTSNNEHSPEAYYLTVNEDMWGGGFVKAVQADNDPELELMAWGAHETKDSFLLDYNDGKIKKMSFSNVKKEIQDLSVEWHQAHITNGMTLSLFIVFILAYYILMGIIRLIVKMVKKYRTLT